MKETWGEQPFFFFFFFYSTWLCRLASWVNRMAAGKSNLDVLGVGSGEGEWCVQNWEGWRERIDACMIRHSFKVCLAPRTLTGFRTWSCNAPHSLKLVKLLRTNSPSPHDGEREHWLVRFTSQPAEAILFVGRIVLFGILWTCCYSHWELRLT